MLASLLSPRAQFALHPVLYYIPSNFSLPPPHPSPPLSPLPPYVCGWVVCERFAKWYSYAIGCAWRIRNPCLVSHESFWCVYIRVCVVVCVCVCVCMYRMSLYISTCLCLSLSVYHACTHIRTLSRTHEHIHLVHLQIQTWMLQLQACMYIRYAFVCPLAASDFAAAPLNLPLFSVFRPLCCSIPPRVPPICGSGSSGFPAASWRLW